MVPPDMGILHRLDESVFDCNPAHVFILNARNDLDGTVREGTPSVEQVAECYRTVVEKILEGTPGVKVHIISCFPTLDKYEKMAPLVRQFYKELKKISKDLDVDFIDVYSKTVGRKDLLKPEYSRDGLHVNEKGYKLLAAAILRSLEK